MTSIIGAMALLFLPFMNSSRFIFSFSDCSFHFSSSSTDSFSAGWTLCLYQVPEYKLLAISICLFICITLVLSILSVLKFGLFDLSKAIVSVLSDSV